MLLFEIIEKIDILKTVNKLAFSGMTSSEINSGDCYNWAAVVKRLIPNSELIRFEGHAFVKIGLKYYDAERLNGVLDWKKLPSNKSGHLYRDYDTFTEAEFYKHWKINKTHINNLIKLVNNGESSKS